MSPGTTRTTIHSRRCHGASPLSGRGSSGCWTSTRAQFGCSSVCAGDGRDVLGALALRPDVADADVTMLEIDPVLAARAWQQAADLHPAPGSTCGWRTPEIPLPTLGAVPADIVLLVGIFGNISDADLARTIAGGTPRCAAPAPPCSGRGGGMAATVPMRFGAAFSRRALPRSVSTLWIATVIRRSGRCGSAMRPSRCQPIGCSRSCANRRPSAF